MKRLLKGKITKEIIMLISVSILFCGCSKPVNTNVADQQTMISSETTRMFHVDLLYHIFSYMDIGEIPSSVYSEDYINEMKTIKEQMGYTENLPELVKPLTAVFKEQYISLENFFFLPFNYSSYDSFKDAVLNKGIFTKNEINDFVKPFLTIMEGEMPFYQKYWEQKVQNDQENTNEFRSFLNDNFSPIECIFTYTRKTPLIVLSYSMSKNGRGLSSHDHLAAAVKSPNSAEDYDDSFFTSLHEMTHSITDFLAGGSGSAIDATHDTRETLAILFDYYLLEDCYPKKVDDYLKFMGFGHMGLGNLGKKLSEIEFLNRYSLNNDLKNKMFQLIQQVEES